MKIVISCEGAALNSSFDEHFGRAAGFLIVDLDSDELDYLPNPPDEQAEQGAGIIAGKRVQETGASALITGHVGGNAQRVLDAAGISIYCGHFETAAEALSAYRAGDLKPIHDVSQGGSR